MVACSVSFTIQTQYSEEGNILQIQNFHEFKIHNRQFKVSYQQFYKHTFIIVVYEENPFGSQGIFVAIPPNGHCNKLAAKLSRFHIQFS